MLITNLFGGGDNQEMRKRGRTLTEAVVQLIVLLALNDEGAPSYDHGNAEFMASLRIPVFACTPDKFPDLMAAALSKRDIGLWAARKELVVKR